MALQFLLQALFLALFNVGLVFNAATDTTTFYQKWQPHLAATTSTSIAGTITYTTSGVDTAIYLGDTFSGNYKPTISSDYGLFFEGEQFAYVKSSTSYTVYSNEMRHTGSTLLIWAMIFDGQKDQIIACKQNRNSGNDVADKLCFGFKDNYYYATIFNETLVFSDVQVVEGWNLLAFIVSQDSTLTYSRLRVVCYTRARVQAGYRTFSYQFYDDIEYELLLGGKYANDGLNITKGFVGYMLEIRLYSSVVLTMANLDDQIDWDCSLSSRKLCEFCPLWVTPLNYCLEDFYATGRASTYLLASYNFNSNVQGIGRKAYTSTLNGKTYLMYFGTPFPYPRQESKEPHRSEVNGLFFDGGDYLYGSIDTSQNYIMTFGNHWTVEMWIRFTEATIKQNYTLFEKIQQFGIDTPMFKAYFSTNKTFYVEMNKTTVLTIYDAYNSTTFPDQWVFVGVNFASLYLPKDKNSNISKSCAYIYGPSSFEKSACGTVNDYYGETSARPYYYDTRIGNGLVGFIKTLYFWNTYKSLTHMYYTPRRNLPRKDKCSAFSQQMHPVCSGCDQFLGSSTCFSPCFSNSYSSTYNYCLTQNCTNALCKVCYYDSASFKNNYCTQCIENAEIVDGGTGKCTCKSGYYYEASNNTCIQCHPNCLTCFGYGDDKCIICTQGKPLWKSRCMNNCGSIEFPQNNTYVYDSKLNTCVGCAAFYYTINSQDCVAQPYPSKLTNYANNYLILEFTQPVKYSGASIKKIFDISISGPKSPYDFTWEAPFWEGGQYQQNVFIQLTIFQQLIGTEVLFLYIDNMKITDITGYQLLKRNSSSQSEFVPLKAPLIERDYISASDRLLIGNAGNSVIISMLITVGVNALISMLSSGSMELVYAFLNVVQIMNYIPIMSLQFPSIMYLMFGYLSIANSDIQILADVYYTMFNLNSETFPKDTTLSTNFAKVGYGSMKIIMNLASQLAIIVAFLIIFPLLLTTKNILMRCCKRGKSLENFEAGFKFNGLLRFYLEGFLEINTAAYVNLTNLEFDNAINILCSILSMLLVCFSLVFPIATGFFLYQNRIHLQSDHHLASKYGALYGEYGAQQWFKYMHTVFFVLRRLIFILMLVFLNGQPLLQLIIFQILNFLMIMVFIMMRPYKHNLINTFSIINESILFIVGFYLFMFLDQNQKDSVLIFYAWIVIGLVIFMVAANLLFIFPYKIRETYLNCKEQARIRRLRHINQVEQKYLFFDYKSFFFNSFKYKQQLEIRTRPRAQRLAESVYFGTRASDDGKDKIPPEPYSQNIPLALDKDNPMDVVSEGFPEQFESQRSLGYNDGVDPFPYAKDKLVITNEQENQMPGFQWLDGEGGPPPEEPEEEFKEDAFEPLPQMNPFDYPKSIQQSPSHSKKKSVTFHDLPEGGMNHTDGFQKPSPPRDGGFFQETIRKSLQEGSDDDDLFKRDPLEGSIKPDQNPLW